jgi:hypothetical protein
MTSQRYRALLIGNSHYPEDPGNLPDLKGPINDVSALGRVLSEESTSLFSPAEIKLLTDRQSYEISAELEELLAAARRDDVLLIYFSGHGITADNGSLLLCARNSRTDRRLTTTVSAETITRMTDQSAAATTIIVLDCCYAGAFKTGDVAAELAGRGRYVLAATRSRDRARDAEHGTGFSRFTAHLLRGLQGAAAQPGAPYVTVSDLYQYLHRSMAEDGPFVPQRRFDGDGDPALARTSPRATQDLNPPSVPERGRIQPTAGPAGSTPPTPRRGRRRLMLVTVAVLAIAAIAGAALATTGLPGTAVKGQPRIEGQASANAPVPGSSAGPTALGGTTRPASRPTPTQPASAPKRQATSKPAVAANPSATIKVVTRSTGSISSPEGGAKVKDCAYFSGTAHLAKGKTLILAMRNLDNDDDAKYVEQVFGWDEPDQLSSWQGAQYFNGEPGQRYAVELMAVDLEAVRATPDRPASDALAAKGTSLAVREVEREAGTVGNVCPGPE